MTTIAWDGKTLATDSMVTSDETILSTVDKKLYLDVGRFKAVATCGSAVKTDALIFWIKEGEEGSPPKMGEDDCILCVTSDGDLYVYWHHDSDCHYCATGNMAAGSGSDIAFGALDAGATAVEAIKIASKRNVYTGGKVQSYTFKKEGR